MEEPRIYEGAKAIDCEFGNQVIVGEDSFARNCTFGDYVQINRRNILENTVFGTGSYTGANTVIKHANIGRYCSISWNVSATGNQHNYRRMASHPLAELTSFGMVEQNTPLNHQTILLGNDVWVGANVCILPGVVVGDGAVIGAGGVLTKDVPPYAIVVGNPGRVIKYRFDNEIISLLLEAKWWNWPHQTLKEKIELFKREMTLDIAREVLQISKELK